MSLIRLPYLGSNTYGEVSKSPNGYNEVKGIEQYNNAKTRNVKVVKVDVLFNLEEYFSISTLEKYRDVIYYIVAGYGTNGNSKLITESLEELYKIDDIFKDRFGKIFYFRDTALENLSIYDAFIEDIKMEINKSMNVLINKIPHVKIIQDSKLYLYISISNQLDLDLIKDIKGLEVISVC